MTFVAPPSSTVSSGVAVRLPLSAKSRLPLARVRAADEDSARRALGTDFVMPAALTSGTVLEDLARIALG